MIPQRVAYVVSTFPKISETFILGELAELDRRGVDVRVLSLKTPNEPFQHASVKDGLLARTTYGPRSFDAVIDAFEPDLVHAHFATDPTTTARALAKRRGVPFTFTAHGYDVYRRPPNDFADRATAAAGVVTVSEANSRHLTTALGVPAERLHVIPCGVDTDWLTPDVEPATPRIVCVARLREVKRLDILLRACARVRDEGEPFECVIVGEGPERHALEVLRAELALDTQVHMPGAAEQEEVRRWWRSATIAALSSRSEGMPVSLMEAAACGVPAVAPRVGGIPELIEHGVTGLVAEPEDPDSLAEGFVRLLRSHDDRKAMRVAARARAVARFSRAEQVDRLMSMWSAILQ